MFRAMEKLEGAVDKLRRDDSGETRGAFLNDVVMGEVLAELKDIAARGGVSCTCGSKKYKVKILYSAVELTCADCGAKLRLPAATGEDLEDLCCKYTLLIGGKEA